MRWKFSIACERERLREREVREELRWKENNEKEKKEGSILLLPLTCARAHPCEKGEGDEEKARKRERRMEEEFTHMRELEREEKNRRESWKRQKKMNKKLLLFLTCTRASEERRKVMPLVTDKNFHERERKRERKRERESG